MLFILYQLFQLQIANNNVYNSFIFIYFFFTVCLIPVLLHDTTKPRFQFFLSKNRAREVPPPGDPPALAPRSPMT